MALDRRPCADRAASRGRGALPVAGSTITATATATVSRSTRRARRWATRTWAGRTPATPCSIPTAPCVKGPKALCELQGYVYAAWTGMAEIYDALGKPDEAAPLRAQARRPCSTRFNEAFWDEEAGFYAFALDGDKKKVLSVASNPGHCLWTGIVRPDRAARVVERLMAHGHVRAAGASARCRPSTVAFNPYSYHNGSVWPHDNSLIALGMKRYGFAERSEPRRPRASAAPAASSRCTSCPSCTRASRATATQFPGTVSRRQRAAGMGGGLRVRARCARSSASSRTRRTGVLYLDPVLPAWLPDIRSQICGSAIRFSTSFRRSNGETSDRGAARRPRRGEVAGGSDATLLTP